MDARFERVPDRPGVVTNAELRNLCLGIVSELNLLCCLRCEPLFLLAFPTVAKHVHSHIQDTRRYTTAVIQDACSRHGVYQGLLDALPKPIHPAPPFPALPYRDGFVCLACEDDSVQQILFSESSRRAHFSKHHPELAKDRQLLERPAKLQTFCSGYKNNALYFEVFPEMAVHGLDDDPDDPNALDELITRNANAHDLTKALLEGYRPVHHPATAAGDGRSLKDTHPTLYWTGWAAHAADRDLDMLVELAKPAEPGDPLHRIVLAARKAFNRDQKSLNDLSEPVRLALKDDGSGKTPSPFKPLEPEARAEYAATMGRWCVFVLRMYQQRLRGDDRYPVTFTEKQLNVCRHALDYCVNGADYSGRTCVLNLAHQFWGPSSLKDFQHLLEDRMDDPTARFACLVNLQSDGSFAPPRAIAHNVVQLKYLIRAFLLMYARDHKNQSLEDPVASVMQQVAPYVSRRFVTPFASVASVVATASKYAATTSNAPNVLWTDGQTLSVDGFRIRFDDFRGSISDHLLDTERHVLDEVFQGLTPESMGFD
ncbi:hypothetical protein FRC06_003869, partial [Ceratobasidium sp. 370]